MNEDELFVISAIKRSDIADDLNGYIADDQQEWEEWETGEEVLPTDPRLTKEFCQEYADGLYCCEDDFQSEEEVSNRYYELARRMRKKLLSQGIADAI